MKRKGMIYRRYEHHKLVIDFCITNLPQSNKTIFLSAICYHMPMHEQQNLNIQYRIVIIQYIGKLGQQISFVYQ